LPQDFKRVQLSRNILCARA